MRNIHWLIIGALAIVALATATARKWFTPVEGAAYDPYFDAAEKRSNLPPGLLSRIAYQESAYNPYARSGAGAIGLMQIVPRWHPNVDATDPIDSIYYAGQFMRENYDMFKTWGKALAAYNWGPGNLNKALIAHGDDWLDAAPRETQNYVRDITADVGIA